MTRQEIILHLESVDQLIAPCLPSPFLKRRLREDAEAFIIERAMNLPRKGDTKVILYLPESEAAEARDVPAAFHQHFAFRQDEAQRELIRIRRFGWRSLLIGFVFLGAMILLLQIIRQYIPTGYLSSVLQDGLTILAWVALWRPGELLLYEWYPFKRDVELFWRLQRAELEVIAEAQKPAHEIHGYSGGGQ